MLAFAAAAPAARAVPLSGTVLVDRPSGVGTLPFDGFADSDVSAHSLSADGRYVVFASAANALLAGAESSATNVYRLDLSTGTLVQANRSASGGQPTPGSDSYDVSISADGNYVGFITTSAATVPGASNRAPQFVVKNLTTGAVEDASVGNGAGGAPVANLQDGVLSGDGRHVAFTAESAVVASNATGVAGQEDAYLRSLDANTTEMVSVTSTGAEGGGVRSAPDIDYAGDAVAFATTSTLVPGDTNSGEDAYVRDVAHEQTLLVSFASAQTPGAEGGFDVAVAGQTGALDLAWDNGGADWFAPCSTVCTTPAMRVDNAKTGGSDENANAGAPFFPPEPSGNLPTRVYFTSFYGLDPADTNNADDIYGWDIGNTNYNTSIHLMTDGTETGGAGAGSATDTGSVTIFGSDSSNLPGSNGSYSQVYRRAGGVDTDISQPLSQPVRVDTAGSAFLEPLHAVSADGSVVAFTSEAPALGATPGTREINDQVLTRNVVSDKTLLLSVAANGATPGNGDSDDPGIDAAGDKVVFQSSASNLVAGDLNSADDVFLRNLVTGRTTLVDQTAGGGFPLSGASSPEISADGTKVVFVSSSVDIPGAPPDGNRHVYEVDLATGDVTLIDQTSSGQPANGDADEADINANGERVAFESDAANLGGDSSSGDSVYVRDLTHPAAPATIWVSKPQNGLAADDDAREPAIDGDGQRVAWVELNSSFGDGMTGDDQIFVRNLTTNATTLGSTGPSGAQKGDGFDPSLSEDGSRLSFDSDATNLPGALPGYTNVYVRDLVTGTTVLGSARNGGSSSGRFGSDAGSLSGNGACLAFYSQSDDLVSGGYGSDFYHVYLHALSSACPPPAPVPAPAPVVTKLSVTHKRFALGAKATALSARRRRTPRGTAFKFTLNEAARTKIVITGKHGKVLLTLVRKHTHKGANKVAFSGRYRHKHLANGTYKATITATNAAGKRSKPRSVKFTVV